MTSVEIGGSSGFVRDSQARVFSEVGDGSFAGSQILAAYAKLVGGRRVRMSAVSRPAAASFGETTADSG
jgi:hypothetical protein